MASRTPGLDALTDGLGELQRLLANDLVSFEQELADATGGSARVHDASRHLVRLGGKRLRPMCVMLASKLGTDGALDAGAVDIAVAAELVHSATAASRRCCRSWRRPTGKPFCKNGLRQRDEHLRRRLAPRAGIEARTKGRRRGRVSRASRRDRGDDPRPSRFNWKLGAPWTCLSRNWAARRRGKGPHRFSAGRCSPVDGLEASMPKLAGDCRTLVCISEWRFRRRMTC